MGQVVPTAVSNGTDRLILNQVKSENIPTDRVAAATGFLTTFGYNAADKLTSVSQGALQQRTFQNDNLFNLTGSYNPEGGATTFSYDANGHVVTRTLGTGTTTYTWDSLHRLLGKSYSDGTTPSATFNYDETNAMGQALSYTVGRKSSEYTGPISAVSSQSAFNYDKMGRVVNDFQCTPKNCAALRTFNFSYGYDLLGDMLSYSNGNGWIWITSSLLWICLLNYLVFRQRNSPPKMKSQTGSWIIIVLGVTILALEIVLRYARR